MLKPPTPRELATTAFLFTFVITTGLFYTLSARFHLLLPWFIIPAVALVIAVIVYRRARVRHDATPTDRQPPQTP